VTRDFRGDLARAGGALAVSIVLAVVSVALSGEYHARAARADAAPLVHAALQTTPAAVPAHALARAGALALLAEPGTRQPAADASFTAVAMAACRGEPGFADAAGRRLAGLARVELDGAAAYAAMIDGPAGPAAVQASLTSITGVEPRPDALVLSMTQGEAISLPCARPARAALAVESDLIANAAETGEGPPAPAAAFASSPLETSAHRVALEMGVRPRTRPVLARTATAPPSLFGTIALQADGVAPADWRLDMALGARSFAACLDAACAPGAARWAQWAEELEALDPDARLERANRLVNSALTFSPDLSRTALEDAWITPEQLMSASEGDCEDFALAKYWLLRAAGAPAEDLYIMVVRDLAAGAPHAFLAARRPDGFRILDSRTPELLTPDALSDIVPVITVSSARQYLHGVHASAS